MTVSVLPAHQYEHCQQLTKQFKKLLNPVDKMKTEHISHSLQMNLYYCRLNIGDAHNQDISKDPMQE